MENEDIFAMIISINEALKVQNELNRIMAERIDSLEAKVNELERRSESC